MREHAELVKTEELNWKNGYVQCACGWRKELGDGFNGYHIDACPDCTPELRTRVQRKVTTGSPRHGLTVELGQFTYFVIKNCMHVQYGKKVSQTFTGLSERQADRISPN